MAIKMKIIANPSDMKKAKGAMRRLKGFGEKGLSTEIKRCVTNIDMKAKQRVAIGSYANAGNLKRGFNYGVSDKTAYNENVVHYAPYVEFGTGSSYDGSELSALGIPEKYAAQFKGKSQDRVHLPARPFLFNSAREAVAEMYNSITNKLKKIK